MPSSLSFKHSSVKNLRQFTLGMLDDNESEIVAQHLHHYADCDQLLDSIMLEDPFLTVERKQSSDNNNDAASSIIQIEGYEIISELGRGGMGVVYKAIDQRLKRPVALKVIINGEHSSAPQRERLRLEAETIATLQHPGIVQIYEIGEYQRNLYLALELLDSQGLQTITNEAPHEAKWSAALIKQLAETIHYSHQQGIIHRDLKPANILFSLSGNSSSLNISQFKLFKKNLPILKITDFGLAKCLTTDGQMTKTGVLLGTPHYMAPEQIPDSGEEVGFASDIYALGVLLYQLLTGQLPFASNNLMHVLKMLRNDDPIAPRQMNATIPRDLETICLKCLMKKPGDRYASAQALAEDLNLFLQDEPILAKPLTLLQRGMRWVRQKPVMGIGYLLLLCLYCLHLFVMLVLNLPSHQGLFHTALTFSTISLALFFYAVQKMLESERWQQLGQYACMGMTVIVITINFMFDSAAQSAPINIYALSIMGAALISPRPKIIWLQTLLSIIGYVSLLGFAHWFRPQLQVTAEVALFFILNLILTGVITYLLIRRISSLQ